MIPENHQDHGCAINSIILIQMKSDQRFVHVVDEFFSVIGLEQTLFSIGANNHQIHVIFLIEVNDPILYFGILNGVKLRSFPTHSVRVIFHIEMDGIFIHTYPIHHV